MRLLPCQLPWQLLGTITHWQSLLRGPLSLRPLVFLPRRLRTTVEKQCGQGCTGPWFLVLASDHRMVYKTSLLVYKTSILVYNGVLVGHLALARCLPSLQGHQRGLTAHGGLYMASLQMVSLTHPFALPVHTHTSAQTHTCTRPTPWEAAGRRWITSASLNPHSS